MNTYQAELAKLDPNSTIEKDGTITYVNPGGPNSAGAGGYADWTNIVKETGQVSVTLWGENPGKTDRPVSIKINGVVSATVSFAALSGWHDSAPVKLTIPAGAKIETAYGVNGGPNIDAMTVVSLTAPPPPDVPPVVVVPVPTSRPTILTTSPAPPTTFKTITSDNFKPVSGTTYTGLKIMGQVSLTGLKNIKFINCIIDAMNTAWYCIRCDKASGIVIQNCELKNAKAAGVYGHGFSAINCYVHRIGGDGFKPLGNCLIQGCYVTQLGWMDPTAHADGVQISGGSNIIVRGNFFDMPRNVVNTLSGTNLFVQGVCYNITFDGNWCIGGNYCLHFYPDGGTGCSVTGNTYYTGTSQYGFSSMASNVTWSGNKTQTGQTALPNTK